MKFILSDKRMIVAIYALLFFITVALVVYYSRPASRQQGTSQVDYSPRMHNDLDVGSSISL